MLPAAGRHLLAEERAARIGDLERGAAHRLEVRGSEAETTRLHHEAPAVRLLRARCQHETLQLELRQRCAALTPREMTVMTLVVAGWRNKQIAGKIHTSEATVKVHRTNLMRKMQASSLADLIAMGGRLGFSNKSLNTSKDETF